MAQPYAQYGVPQAAAPQRGPPMIPAPTGPNRAQAQPQQPQPSELLEVCSEVVYFDFFSNGFWRISLPLAGLSSDTTYEYADSSIFSRFISNNFSASSTAGICSTGNFQI